jgi:hypothetical protein
LEAEVVEDGLEIDLKVLAPMRFAESPSRRTEATAVVANQLETLR